MVVKLLRLALEERVALNVAGERRTSYGLGDPVRDVEGRPALLPTGPFVARTQTIKSPLRSRMARPAKSLGRDCLLS